MAENESSGGGSTKKKQEELSNKDVENQTTQEAQSSNKPKPIPSKLQPNALNYNPELTKRADARLARQRKAAGLRQSPESNRMSRRAAIDYAKDLSRINTMDRQARAEQSLKAKLDYMDATDKSFGGGGLHSFDKKALQRSIGDMMYSGMGSRSATRAMNEIFGNLGLRSGPSKVATANRAVDRSLAQPIDEYLADQNEPKTAQALSLFEKILSI